MTTRGFPGSTQIGSTSLDRAGPVGPRLSAPFHHVEVELLFPTVRTRRGRVLPVRGLDRCSPILFGKELEHARATLEA